MAENYYSNNSELNEAVSAFEDAIETSGNGEASFGVAGEDWERVEISQPPYTYPDAQFYALYDNGFQAPFLVCCTKAVRSNLRISGTTNRWPIAVLSQ